MRAVSRLIGLGGSYSAAAGCASVALLLITLTNGAYVSLEAQDIPTACTVDRGTPIAASISGAVEARNSVITRDADNLKAMVAGGQISAPLKSVRARVIRQDSLWVHSSDPKRQPTATDSIWVLDHGLGHRREREASLSMLLYLIRVVDGELLGTQGWIASQFCLR